MTNNIKQLLADFIKHLAQDKKVSFPTIKNYHFYLRRFIKVAKIRQAQDITSKAVEKFHHCLSQVRNQRGETMKPSTQNYHLIALRSFLNYLQHRGITTLASHEVKLMKTKKRPSLWLENTDWERLLEAPLHTKNPGLIQKRDKAILELLFTTGLKVSELSKLRRDQINLLADEFIIKGINNSVRRIPLQNQTKYWLKQYLAARTDNLPALFVRHDKAKKNPAAAKNHQLTPRSIQRIVKKYAKKTELNPNITPQSLRNSYAQKLWQEGRDLKTIQAMLGHSSISTTKIYSKS